jgi:hypothetical protein
MHGDAMSSDAQVTQSAVFVHMIHLGKHEREATLYTRQGVPGNIYDRLEKLYIAIFDKD